MCLDLKFSNKTVKEMVNLYSFRVGFKVLYKDSDDGSLLCALAGNHKPLTLEKEIDEKPYRSECSKNDSFIKCCTYGKENKYEEWKYRKGFHCYISLEDAKEDCDFDSGYEIHKVWIGKEDIVAIGMQHKKVVVVSKKIMIEREAINCNG